MKRVVIGIVFAALSLGAGAAVAAPADDACAALMEARGHLVGLIGATNKADMDALKTKVHDASAKLDGILAGMAGADAAKAGEFKSVWAEFKDTRETGIIPAVYAGKPADAKALATGIQAERMKKMKGVMGCK